jgi:hypothetical protein
MTLCVEFEHLVVEIYVEIYKFQLYFRRIQQIVHFIDNRIFKSLKIAQPGRNM